MKKIFLGCLHVLAFLFLKNWKMEMPIYEYQCPKCGKVFEEWAKSSEAHKDAKCPVCGTPSPRIMSRTSFVLKGDGWYVSDYGYRKGITEDSGTGADVPMSSSPRTPAKQGDKTVARSDVPPAKGAKKNIETAENKAKKADSKPAEKKSAPKTETKSSDKKSSS